MLKKSYTSGVDLEAVVNLIWILTHTEKTLCLLSSLTIYGSFMHYFRKIFSFMLWMNGVEGKQRQLTLITIPQVAV